MNDTLKLLESIEKSSGSDLKKVKNLKEFEKLRTQYLGRKSKLTKILRSIQNLPQKDRPSVGKKSNEVRKALEASFLKTQGELEQIQSLNEASDIDVTIPALKKHIGHIHPNTQMIWRIQDIFQLMGFEVFEPYDIDDDYHTFTSLNLPEGHPARDIWDTFWTEEGFIPITHTSSMQNRVMKMRKPPIRAVVIGHTFRNERTDPRHEHTLFQCEGIYVDKGITLSDMIGTLKIFFSKVFEKDVKVKLDPDYFPFVEPGNGMALSCTLCDQKGCRVCKYTGWLEILGCGMIHPFVLREGGIDPDVYSGFAWGFGVDRLVMLREKIEDIRHFHSGDLRFIRQF
ncbi:MAG: phenylalanine--tRNA ligase subunit alpha [Candidatus Dojkabacteria bacterium]|nr:phenylalanine--tRNA ligase subunit alpha [Candidatus Dojkabacteria bacterium]